MSIKNENNKKCSHPECNKKIKLTDYPCKCGKYFCKLHIFSKDHLCNYDYKENKNKKIKIEQMKCKAKKIEQF